MHWLIQLLLVAVISAQVDDVLDFEARRPNQFTRVKWMDRPDAGLAKGLKRKRREAEKGTGETLGQNCKIDGSAMDKKMSDATNHHFFNADSNPSIALAWAGDDGDTIIAVTTYESFVSKPSHVYRTIDSGATWTEVTHQLANEMIRRKSGVLTSPADTSRVIMVVNNHPIGYADSSEIYVTKDKGATWERRNVPFEMNGANLKFHQKNAEAILATDASSGKLYVTDDFGENWSAVHDSGRTHSYKWDDTDTTGKTFFYTHDPTGLGRKQNFALTLYRSTDGGKSTTKLAEHVWSFGVEDKFIFVSVAYKPKGQSVPTRIMHVSTDHGDTFDAVQLPAISQEQFFSILDADEGMIFMHIDDIGDTGKGVIYTSDSRGIVYTESLKDNLYPNGEDVTDFFRIASLKGVYITSQLKDDSSIESKITFDKGATWDDLTQPANCMKNVDPAECNCNHTTDSYCNLQLHSSFSIAKGVELPDVPYSSATAPGVVIGHGNVGDGLNTDPPDLYISSDGGYSWNRALGGPHRSAIGDSGSVLWAVEHGETVDTLKFSFDEGLCWRTYKFVETAITITGLIAEPGEKATDIAIWGWDDEADCWVVYIFDFKKVLGKQCESSDYENWYGHEKLSKDKYEGCQLGEKRTYTRLKKDSICYNGREHKPEENASRCKCNKYDFKCDFGYKRNSDDDCVPDDTQRKADHICIDGKKDDIVTMGYMKIPGDQCDENGMDEKFKRQETKLRRNCPEEEELEENYGMWGSNDFTDYIDIEDLIDQAINPNQKYEKIVEDGENGTSKSLTAFLVLTILALCGVSGYFYKRSRDKSASVVQYNTMLNDDVEPIDPGQATENSTYRDDQNDSDDDAMLA